MQHSRQDQLVDEARLAENLVGKIDPQRRRSGQAPGCRRLGDDAGGGIACQQAVVGKLPIAGAQVAGPGDGAILDAEILGRHTKSLRRYLEIDRACLSRRIAHGRARLLDRQAARGGALVGALSPSPPRTMRMRSRSHVQLVGSDLRQRRDDALAELDLAGLSSTKPLASNRSQRDRRGLAFRLTGSSAEAFIGPPWPPAARRARHDCGSRTGTGCDRARRAPPSRSARDCASGARRRKSGSPRCSSRTAWPARR